VVLSQGIESCRDLTRRLAAAGVPVTGISRDRIDYADEATVEQRADGDAILAAWDWDATPVPNRVTATQAKLALIDAGLYEYADGMVSVREGEPGGYRFRVVWDATYWYRTSPELNDIAADMGLTEAQVDDLFRLAATK
jgi:protein-disulfide isomerase-like protein with CxxC motif